MVPVGDGYGLPQLPFPSVQGVSNDTSSLETERGFEELPLCSCRMEAPKIDRISERAGHKCMATESVDGEVGPVSWEERCRWVGEDPAPGPSLTLFLPAHAATAVRLQCRNPQAGDHEAVKPRGTNGAL